MTAPKPGQRVRFTVEGVVDADLAFPGVHLSNGWRSIRSGKFGPHRSYADLNNVTPVIVDGVPVGVEALAAVDRVRDVVAKWFGVETSEIKRMVDDLNAALAGES